MNDVHSLFVARSVIMRYYRDERWLLWLYGLYLDGLDGITLDVEASVEDSPEQHFDQIDVEPGGEHGRVLGIDAQVLPHEADVVWVFVLAEEGTQDGRTSFERHDKLVFSIADLQQLANNFLNLLPVLEVKTIDVLHETQEGLSVLTARSDHLHLGHLSISQQITRATYLVEGGFRVFVVDDVADPLQVLSELNLLG